MGEGTETFAGGPKEACGVFGILAPDVEVARTAFFGIYALQHRGQESAGVATTDGQRAYVHRGMGLVTQVFNEGSLSHLKGHIAIGHTRYSTTGASEIRNAQPLLIETLHGPLGVAHNGNLTNAKLLRQQLLEAGIGLSTSSDSEVILKKLVAASSGTVAAAGGDHWSGPIRSLMREAEGAYSLVVLTRDALFAVRDPHGLRPLCLGTLQLEGDRTAYVVASESCALSTVGAKFVRDVTPGEIVRIDREGLHSSPLESPPPKALCVFEYVYFARPDTEFEGRSVHLVRQRFGEALARECPADADIVIGVPDCAIPSALGFSHASGIPLSEGLVKNRYIGRTFIQPGERLRKDRVRLKYNALGKNLRGRRVVVVDDSIVRGNTAGPMVKLLREHGATEVHFRVSSPPVRHPCYMGVDMGTRRELIGSNKTIEEIRQHIGADTLGYLSVEGMMAALGSVSEDTGHCTACFSGRYPINVAQNHDEEGPKLAFEGIRGH